jgi:hypothetical protein
MNFSVPLASGRDADVFVIDSNRVLRRYRNGGDVTGVAPGGAGGAGDGLAGGDPGCRVITTFART